MVPEFCFSFTLSSSCKKSLSEKLHQALRCRSLQAGRNRCTGLGPLGLSAYMVCMCLYLGHVCGGEYFPAYESKIHLPCADSVHGSAGREDIRPCRYCSSCNTLRFHIAFHVIVQLFSIALPMAYRTTIRVSFQISGLLMAKHLA